MNNTIYITSRIDYGTKRFYLDNNHWILELTGMKSLTVSHIETLKRAGFVVVVDREIW